MLRAPGVNKAAATQDLCPKRLTLFLRCEYMLVGGSGVVVVGVFLKYLEFHMGVAVTAAQADASESQLGYTSCWPPHRSSYPAITTVPPSSPFSLTLPHTPW